MIGDLESLIRRKQDELRGRPLTQWEIRREGLRDIDWGGIALLSMIWIFGAAEGYAIFMWAALTFGWLP